MTVSRLSSLWTRRTVGFHQPSMAITVSECGYAPRNAQMFYVDLHGSIILVTVTDAASVVRKWIRSVLYRQRNYRLRLVVGMGVQWTPGGDGEDPPPDTLQLCVGCRCLIYQLAHTDYVPMFLRRFLMDANHTFVGFWNHSDARKLLNSKFRLTMWRDPLDLRHYVETDDGESLTRASVEEIVEECLGFEGFSIDKEISMSHWGKRHLTKKQVLQACLDAHCAFRIGKNIKAWKF